MPEIIYIGDTVADVLTIKNAKTEEEHQINRRTEFKVIKYDLLENEKDEERFFNNN